MSTLDTGQLFSLLALLKLPGADFISLANILATTTVYLRKLE